MQTKISQSDKSCFEGGVGGRGNHHSIVCHLREKLFTFQAPRDHQFAGLKLKF
jgi:hypothetical protein